MKFMEWTQTEQARELAAAVAVAVQRVETADLQPVSVTVSSERVGALEPGWDMQMWGYPFLVRADVPVDRIEIGVAA